VYQVPILFSPPWINKYYVLDLAPGKSLVEWAVRHGHTCFMISYRNPDESLRDVGMSDYLREGPLAALEVIERITGAPSANLVALCLGGTLATATAAWLAARHRPGVHTLTLMNTLLDFQAPGQLGVFTDPEAVGNLIRLMRRQGYLPAGSMKATFDLLRATDLVWNFVVEDWMLGTDPAPFDLLSWNSDSTRMPATMQAEYLRTCYLENQLATGRMELAGERLNLAEINQESYVITAEFGSHRPVAGGVHRSPAARWPGAVRAVQLRAHRRRGEPAEPQVRYWFTEGERLPADPSDWRELARERAASWWTDWTPWIEARAGARRQPPELGGPAYPPLADAPGSYVVA